MRAGFLRRLANLPCREAALTCCFSIQPFFDSTSTVSFEGTWKPVFTHVLLAGRHGLDSWSWPTGGCHRSLAALPPEIIAPQSRRLNRSPKTAPPQSPCSAGLPAERFYETAVQVKVFLFFPSLECFCFCLCFCGCCCFSDSSRASIRTLSEPAAGSVPVGTRR